MKVNKTILRNTINIIAVSILLISFRKAGIYFDDFNLSIYDVIIMLMSALGLSKLNDFLS
ncbi:Uncharacterised protein [Serratia fonticola]|nr:Uncharacterised protein [Serratia fonticola]